MPHPDEPTWMLVSQSYAVCSGADLSLAFERAAQWVQDTWRVYHRGYAIADVWYGMSGRCWVTDLETAEQVCLLLRSDVVGEVLTIRDRHGREDV